MTARRGLGWGLLGLTLIALVFSALNWLKISSLWNDVTLWLFESYRSATGEVLYRDFSYPYPPLGVLVFGLIFRVFGASFEVAQVALSGLSWLVVVAHWLLARRVLREPLAWLTAATLAVVMGAGGGPSFNFFALQTSLPAQHIAMLGLALLLIALIDYAQQGTLPRRRWALIAIGAALAILTKPEQALAALAAVAVVAVLDRFTWFQGRSGAAWLRRYLQMAVVVIVPAVVGYVLVGWQTGFDNLALGLTGYGAGALMCAWWPTGIGLFGVATALAQWPLTVALASLPRFKALRLANGRRYLGLWVGAALGGVLTLAYLPAALRVAGFSAITWDLVARHFTSPGALLLPVLWVSVVRAVGWIKPIGLAWRQSRPLPTALVADAVLAAAVIVMASRSFFGDIFSLTPLTPIAAMPLLLILWPRWLLATLSRFKVADGAVVWPRVAAALLLIFMALNGARAVMDATQGGVVTVTTEAGTVRLADAASVAVLDYVRANSAAGEPVLDVNYGGGVNFALHRSSPLYLNQFQLLFPPDRIVRDDLARFSAAPPRLVIGNEWPDFNATFGVQASTRCTFPRLVWRPDELAYDPARSFPVIEAISQAYVPVAKFDGVVVLERR